MKPKRRRGDAQKPTKAATRRTEALANALAEVGDTRRGNLLRAAARQPVVRVRPAIDMPAEPEQQLRLWET